MRRLVGSFGTQGTFTSSMTIRIVRVKFGRVYPALDSFSESVVVGFSFTLLRFTSYIYAS